MATMSSKLVLELLDRVSGPARNVTAGMQRFASSVKSFGTNLRSSMLELSIASATAAVVTRKALGSYLEIEGARNELEALGLSHEQIVDAMTRGDDIARRYAVSSKDAAEAMLEATRSGLSFKDAVAGMQGGAIFSALSGGKVDPKEAVGLILDLGTAADVFGKYAELASDRAGRLNDMLADTIASSKFGAEGLKYTFRYMAPAAGATGMLTDEMLALGISLKRLGLADEQVGTIGREMLSTLGALNAKQKALLKSRGINWKAFFNAEAVTVPELLDSITRNTSLARDEIEALGPALDKIMAGPGDAGAKQGALAAELQRVGVDIAKAQETAALAWEQAGRKTDLFGLVKQLKKLSPEDFSKLFGVQGIAIRAALDKSDLEEIRLDILSSAGEAAQRAKIMNQGLKGALDQLGDAIEQFSRKVFDSGLADDLAAMANGLTNFVDSLGKLDATTLRAIGWSTAFLAALAPVGLALATIGAIGRLAGAPVRLLASALVGLPVDAKAAGDALEGTADNAGKAAGKLGRIPWGRMLTNVGLLTLAMQNAPKTLEDPKGMIAAITPGQRISVFGGTNEKGVRNFGLFTVDDVTYEGYPQKVTINAQASDVTSSEKERDTKGFPDDEYPTYQDIFSEVAGKAGLALKMDGEIGGKPNPTEGRDREDPLGFLTRLGKKIGATVTVKEKQLIVVPRGSGRSASGQAMGSIMIAPGVNLLSYSVSLQEKQKHTEAEGAWFDRRKMEWKQEKEALKRPGGKVPFRLRQPFKDDKEAKEAAKGYADELSRNQGTANFTIDGTPFAAAESFAMVAGVRSGVDGRWFIKTATHNFSSTSPYTTSLECEFPIE